MNITQRLGKKTIYGRTLTKIVYHIQFIRGKIRFSVIHQALFFGVKNLNLKEIKGKKIFEVGAGDVNESLRPIIESWAKPAEYIGIDIEKGGVFLSPFLHQLSRIYNIRDFAGFFMINSG